MSSAIRNRTRHPVRALAVYGGVFLSAGLVVGCASEPGEGDQEVAFASFDQAIEAVAGDPLPGTNLTAFAEGKDLFDNVDEPDRKSVV